ncbi:putative DNA-binding protein [Fructilactobacillus vespulae]|uniref:putative DNA-binding protein n=1 Tax=Fructilactobacillus vespulae TaxID=1249630 RepID=UPI0039B3C284
MMESFEAKLNKDNHINSLYDFYGSLLTKKQADYISQYYADDFSLGEISENFGVSRQAVYDNIRRTEKTLENYEKKMNLYKHFVNRNEIIDELSEYINENYANDQKLSEIVKRLEKVEEE